MDAASMTGGPFTTERYFELVECGILSPDDRVELLDGFIVAMPPSTPLHDSVVHIVLDALQEAVGRRAAFRVQSSFLVGSSSALQPDIALVPGNSRDYIRRHPTRAHLLVEVALTSLPQDRLSKSVVYARAAVPCYWIVNLRDGCVEVYRDVDRWKGTYGSVTSASGNDLLAIDDFPGVTVRAGDLLPPSSLS